EIAMHYRTIKGIVGLFAVIGVFCFAVKPMPATTFDNNNGPELPAGCDSIQVPEGNKLAFHAYARGAQVYKWNGATWDFVAPVATLYAESDYFGEVVRTMLAHSGKARAAAKVKAARVPDTGCVPDSSAIAWLLLKKTQTSGNGIFTKVTY